MALRLRLVELPDRVMRNQLAAGAILCFVGSGAHGARVVTRDIKDALRSLFTMAGGEARYTREKFLPKP